MPDFDGPRKNARARNQWRHGVRGLFAAVFCRRKQLDLPHFLPNLKPGSRASPGEMPYLRHRSRSFPGASCYTAVRFRSFPGNPGGESGSASLCTDALPVFSAQSGRRVWGRSAVQRCASSVFWETQEQSCAHARIEWGNPVPTPGLSGAILCPRQD